jgi:hypothetical protein
MLSDALKALRTFDVFHAFRASSAAEGSMALGAQLAWDPPTSATWDEATHVARGLHGRAEQLFLAMTSAQIDPNLWRERRTLADAAHDLLDLADALGGYRDAIDRLGVGEASGALGQLDKIWAQWEATAARWGVSRAEVIGCARSTLHAEWWSQSERFSGFGYRHPVADVIRGGAGADLVSVAAQVNKTFGGGVAHARITEHEARSPQRPFA